MDDEHSVGAPPHVELDAVRAELARERERLDRVLTRLSGSATMCEDERARRRGQAGSQTM
jgi:hypothetical protein